MNEIETITINEKMLRKDGYGQIRLKKPIKKKCNVIVPEKLFDLEVKQLPSEFFKDCTGIEAVQLPDTIQALNSCAFSNCAKLKSINIPKKVVDISYNAFVNCYNLEKVDIDKDNPFYYGNGQTIITQNKSNCKTLKGHDKKELMYAFKNIDIPEGVVSIYSSAFSNIRSNNNNVKFFNIPASFSLFYKFFNYNITRFRNVLETITVDENNKEYFSRKDCNAIFSDKGCTKLIFGFNNTIIPNGVEQIQPSAFEDCKKIEKITVPESVNYIGASAFCACDSLKEINLLGTIEQIYPYAFANCKNLQSIDLPNGIKSIDEFAFQNCDLLRNINIPKSIREISNKAFEGCKDLEITFTGTIEQLNNMFHPDVIKKFKENNISINFIEKRIIREYIDDIIKRVEFASDEEKVDKNSVDKDNAEER